MRGAARRSGIGAAIAALVFWIVPAGTAFAHVGSPDTFFAGTAGPWAVFVTIRPPGVVPGLAEISVRVDTAPGTVRSVTVRPMLTETGRRGAPEADAARPVPGSPGSYTGALWLMSGGAYAIEVSVDGEAGKGRVLVPVASLATHQVPMGAGLTILVAVFAILLVGGGLAIVFAAASESTLHPGETASSDRRRAALGTTGIAAVVLFALLIGETAWSRRVADVARRELYRPYAIAAEVRTDAAGRVLRVTVVDPRWGAEGWRPLVPDHGKLVHLFAMREPALDAFAHLHPVAVSDRVFEAPLPSLPPGIYSLFFDVTDETGFAQTLVCRTQIPSGGETPASPPPAPPPLLGDPDDSWRLARPLPAVIGAGVPEPSDLGNGLAMRWGGMKGEGRTGMDEAPAAGRPSLLAFSVYDAEARPVALEPYMGMLAHAAVLRDDESVFVHLHPMGTASMASLAVAERLAPPGTTRGKMDQMDQMDGMNRTAGINLAAPAGADGHVFLPYAFPRPGPYRIWVQIKTAGEVRTGVFDVSVR